jgi:hypothetical protein
VANVGYTLLHKRKKCNILCDMEAKLYNFVRSDQTKQPYQNLFGLHTYFIICFLLNYKYSIKIYYPGSFKNLLDQNILACYIAMYIRKYFLVIVEFAKLLQNNSFIFELFIGINFWTLWIMWKLSSNKKFKSSRCDWNWCSKSH